jgi:hypothetical protein
MFPKFNYGIKSEELEEYFDGKRKTFTFSLDLSSVQSSFQRKVLRKLFALPFGCVLSYGELAERAGFPGAARAVGTTMASNPTVASIRPNPAETSPLTTASRTTVEMTVRAKMASKQYSAGPKRSANLARAGEKLYKVRRKQ